MEEPRVEVTEAGRGPDGRRPPKDQSVPELVKSIAADAATLVRKEVELAKQEVVEALAARAKAAAALAVAGVLGLIALVFLGSAAAAGLDNVMRPWASRLIVAAAFLLIAGAAVFVGLRKLKKPSLAPEETKRTVKEDVQWAKAQLKR